MSRPHVRTRAIRAARRSTCPERIAERRDDAGPALLRPQRPRARPAEQPGRRLRRAAAARAGRRDGRARRGRGGVLAGDLGAGPARRGRPRATTCSPSCATPPSRATRRSPGTSPTRPTWRAWAPRSPPSCSPAPGWAWCTSATRAPTSCADGTLTQITKDDTFVQSLIDEGRITEEEAHTHPQRSLLLRAHHRAGRRPVADDPGGPGGRPLPALLRRAVRRGQRRDAGRDAAGLPRPPGVRRPDDRAGAARRRPGQHHLHRGRRRRHRLRRGRPDHGRVGGRRQRGRPAAGLRRRPAPRRPRSPAPRRTGSVAAGPAPRGPRRGSDSGWRVAGARRAGRAGRRRARWPGCGCMQQYYVGVDAEQVVIFQGVRGDVLGVPLHRVDRAHRHRA